MDLKCRPDADFALHIDVAVMLSNEAVDLRQAQSRPFPGWLGGEERIKNVRDVRLIDADPGVRDEHPSPHAGVQLAHRRDVSRLDLDPIDREGQCPAAGHRVPGVDRQVHHDLLESPWIGVHDDLAFRDIHFDQNVLGQGSSHQSPEILHESHEIKWVLGHDGTTAEIQHLLGEFSRPLSLLEDRRGTFPGPRLQVRLLEEQLAVWLIWPEIPRPGYRRARREVDACLHALIQERRRSPTHGEDMLSLLVAEPGIDDGLIRDQMLTMLIAGHDTCTALLSWALYLLGCHPVAMGRAHTEVDTLGTEAWDTSKVESLPFLDGVVKETLRLYPPVHLGMRLAARDLSFHQYRIPAGSRVLYSIYLTHRRAENWPDPDRFSPGRFSDTTHGSRPPYSYIPFGGGPRNCIGASFGLHETKAVLARLLQKFEFELLPGEVRPHMGATLEPHPGVPMRVARLARSAA